MFLLDYLPPLLAVGLHLFNALPGTLRLRVLRPRAAVKTAAPAPSVGAEEASAMARVILREMRPGIAAYHRTPDGGGLLVWWIEPGPAPHGAGDGYRLW
ncbi:hypothetical protein [Streptomyces vilmorinianum]|uniref:hypothetical protein n=1 Tax=Streptomyces vilmorinianum TaxID=3051092 RepID=UPI0010FB938B|nr:hypothetical protein [Streptomyces vilmorinianum]